jgi:protein tyrosine phosphatase (PTP) superfamily phosphohydrolase (DUF442 family)
MPTPFESLAAVPNACQPLPNLVTGGQPTADDLEQFGRAGGGLVIDLRDPMEPRPFDEPAMACRLGLDYVNVPVGAGSLDDATLDRVLTLLRGAGERPVLLHCASGNRVGAALLPLFILDHGLEEEDAIGQAMRVGLRSAELLEWGLDYTRRRLP